MNLKQSVYYKHLPFWIITFSIACALTLPILIQDGMFMDGMLYASVAHNLSLGIGTFWFPQFSYHNFAGLSSFHEHPPLVFWLESLFFKILGSSIYVERFYCFVTLIISVALINSLWKEIHKSEERIRSIGWLPVVLWITIPLCFWCFSNNMMEITMGIFTLASVLLSFKGLQSKRYKIVYFLSAGFFVFLASFSKGVPGFFPIAVPILFSLFTKRINLKQASFYTLLIVIPSILIYLILFSIDESRTSLSMYLFKRALHRINEAPTVSDRFVVLHRLKIEVGHLFAFVLVIFIVSLIKRKKFWSSEKLRLSAFFISIGFAASLPIVLTMVQKGFYIFPCFPFFSLGSSILIASAISPSFEKINGNGLKFKSLLMGSALLLVAVLVFSYLQKGKVSRDREMINDVYVVGNTIHRNQIITVTPELGTEWRLQMYLIRYFNISVDTEKQNEFFLIEKGKNNEVPTTYSKMNVATLTYDLYVKKN